MGDPAANRFQTAENSGDQGTEAAGPHERLLGDRPGLVVAGPSADAPVSKCPGVTLGAVDRPIGQFRAVRLD